MLKYCSTFLVAFITLNCLAQDDTSVESEINLLQVKIEKAGHDTTKINALWEWDDLVYFYDPVQESLILEQIISICNENLETDLNINEKLFFGQNLAKGLNYLGSACNGLGGYEKAIKLHLEAIPVYKALGQINGLDGNYINLGIAYYFNGEIKNSIKYYNLGLKTTDKSGNLKYKSNALAGLAGVYLEQGDYEKALSYYREAQEIDNNSVSGLEHIYLNMGSAYLYMDELDSANFFYHKALKLGLEIEDYYTLGTTMNNLGEVYLKMNQLDSSYYFYIEGLKIREELEQQRGLVYSYSGLSSWYLAKEQGEKAVEFGEKALNLSQNMNSYMDRIPAVQSLNEAYKFVNNYKKAFETSELLHEILDSVQNSHNQKALISQEVEYEYEKNKIADSLAYSQQTAINDLEHQNELEKEAQERYALYVGLVSVLLLGVFAYLGFRRKKADNEIISEQKRNADLQKDQIQEAHKEITDSIAYAKRIQSAILPPKSLVEELLPDSFVLYKPKDVVAGDFYWMEKIGDDILFAAADCTGHGVPGAMVSVICNGALNRSVREFKLTDPGLILDKAREIVIQEFEKSEEDVKDGMDIALCSLSGNKLKYAGANNPLWISRDGEILETKANKQPIGKFYQSSPFITHEFELLKGDIIYIFSDGFVDQFGGDNGKKLKPKSLRNLLVEIAENPLKEQIKLLDQAFESWRGDLEQVDDVCLIAVKI